MVVRAIFESKFDICESNLCHRFEVREIDLAAGTFFETPILGHSEETEIDLEKKVPVTRSLLQNDGEDCSQEHQTYLLISQDHSRELICKIYMEKV